MKPFYALSFSSPVRLAFFMLFFLSMASGAGFCDAQGKGSYEVHILGQRDLATSGTFSLRVVVEDPASAAPLAGIPVEVCLQDEHAAVIGRASLKTDDNGTISPSIPVETKEGKGTLDVTVGAPGDGVQKLTFPVVFRDRSLLGASLVLEHSASGDLLVARLAVFQGQGRGAGAKRPVNVMIRHSGGKTVFRKELLTDGDGFCTLQVPLSPLFSAGDYEFSAVSGMAQTERRFSVPGDSPLDLSLSFNKKSFCPGETLTGTIKVALPDGRPVREAPLHLTIEASGKGVLATIERATDEAGCYRFKSVIPSFDRTEDARQPLAWLNFTAVVTKGAHRKESACRVPVFSHPVFINLVPERNILKQGLANRMTLLAFDADYMPCPAKVMIDSGDFKKEVSTGMSGSAVFDFRTSGKASEIFYVTGIDETGQPVRKEFRMAVERDSRSVLVRADKSLYRAGESITLELFSTETSSPVYLDFSSGGQIFKTESVRLLEGYGKVVLSPDRHFSGLTGIAAHLYGKGGHIQDQGWIWVEPFEDVRLVMSPCKETYIPGEMLPLSLKAFTQNGVPCEALVDIRLQKAGIEQLSPESAGTGLSLFDDRAMSAPPDIYRSFERDIFSDVIQGEGMRQRCASALFLQLHRRQDCSLLSDHLQGSVPAASPVHEPVCLSPSEEKLMVRLARSCGGLERAAPRQASGEENADAFDYVGKKARETHRTEVQADFFAPLPPPETPAQPPAFYPLSFPVYDREGKNLEETYCYDPLVKISGPVQKDILLPLHNCEGTLRVTSLLSQGAFSQKIRVFQESLCALPFIDQVLTEGDSVSIPVKLVNYTPDKKEILLELSKRDWFELKGMRAKKVVIDGYQDGFSFFDIEVRGRGMQKIAIGSTMGGVYQEVRGDVRIRPAAPEVLLARSGSLTGQVTESFSFPEESSGKEGSLTLTLYNGNASQAQGALEWMKKTEPVTSEGLATRILTALELRHAAVNMSAKEKAQLDTLMFSDNARLMEFEGEDGGFSRFSGESPGIITTACALIAAGDMRKLHAVNEAGLRRTVRWLLKKRDGDGSWPPDETHRCSRITTTAYALWALLECGVPADDLLSSLSYVKKNAGEVPGAYTLALITLVMNMADREAGAGFSKRLLSQATKSGNWYYWKGEHSPFTSQGGAGADVELTALCAVALGTSSYPEHDEVARFITAHRCRDGAWGLAPASWLALRALNGMYDGTVASGNVAVMVNGKETHRISLTQEDQGICRRINLSPFLVAGENAITLQSRADMPVWYQLAQKYYGRGKLQGGPVKVTRHFSRQKLTMGERVSCDLRWGAPLSGSVVVVEFPIPWGLRPDEGALRGLKRDGGILGFEIGHDDLTVLLKGSQKEVSLSFVALFPCRISARPAAVYFQDAPDIRGESPFTSLEIE